MRSIVMLLALAASTVCSSAPITYYFSGYTDRVWGSDGNGLTDFSPFFPVVNARGEPVTDGQIEMTGEIVFDPEARQNGAGGSDLGDVLSWTFTTQGLTYYNNGDYRSFHYLTFETDQFRYFDEIPQGGYGPDIVYLDFFFDTEMFAEGPHHFPLEHFVGGRFGTSVEHGWISDDSTMHGLNGTITGMWTAAAPVPAPSSIVLLLAGLAALAARQFRSSGGRNMRS